MKLKAQIMDEAALKRALMRISHEIAERNKGVENLVLVGILRRGEPIARIIRENIQKIEDMTLPCGSISLVACGRCMGFPCGRGCTGAAPIGWGKAYVRPSQSGWFIVVYQSNIVAPP